MSKPVAGEWYEYTHANERVLCVAQNNKDACVIQNKDGEFEVVYGFNFDRLKHLPDCTGWDWQPEPETFPQYYDHGLRGDRRSGTAFIRRDSVEKYACVSTNGCDKAKYNWNEWCKYYVRCGTWNQITEQQALALLDKPQPAEDPEEWVEITDPEHVVRECDQFNPDKGHPEGGWTACCGSVGVKRGTRPHLGFRCRRKDLPKPAKRTVSVPKWLVVYDDGDMEILDRTWAPTGNVHRVGETTYEID